MCFQFVMILRSYTNYSGVAPDSSAAMIERCKAGGVVFIGESDVAGLLEKTDAISDILSTITAAKNHYSTVSK